MTAPVQEHTPHRGLVLAAAAFVTFAVLGGAAGLVSEVFQTTDVRDSTLTSEGSALTVRNEVGDVTLVPSPDDAVHVHAEIRRGLEPPTITERADSDGVLLDARCDTEGFGASCAVDYTVQVPRSHTVRLELGSGRVQVHGLAGGLTVDVPHGSVELRELSGPVDVRTQSGEVSAIGLDSRMVTVDTEFGNIELDLRTAPDAVRARTDDGNVDIRLPSTTTYRVSADAGEALEWIGVVEDPSSPHAVTAGTGSGHIMITSREYGPVAVPVPPRAPEPPGAPAAPAFPR